MTVATVLSLERQAGIVIFEFDPTSNVSESKQPCLATTLGTGIYTLITVAAHDHAGPSVVLSILAAAVTACLGVIRHTSTGRPKVTVQDVDLVKATDLRTPKKSVWKASLELQFLDRVYVPPLPNNLLRLRIEVAIASITLDLLTEVWEEFDFRLDACRITEGAHIKHLKVKLGLCYSEVVTRYPKGGSAYSYAYATSGEILAFLVGWGMVLEYSVGTALAAKSFSQYLDVVFDGGLSKNFENYIGSLSIRGLDEHLDFPSVTITILIAMLLAISAKVLYSFTNVLVVINLLVISGVVLVGIFNMDSENWIAGTGFFPGGISGVFSAASLCYFAFVGYDVLALCTIDSPHRASTYPTLVSTIFLIGLLAAFAMAVVMTLLVPYSLLEMKGSVLQAFDLRQVAGMRYFAAVGALSGLLAAVAASLFPLVKLIQSLSNDGLLFRFLCRTQCHTLLTATILCSFLSFFCDMSALVHVLGMGTLISSIAVAVSVLCLRYGVASRIRSPSDLLELSDESNTATPKIQGKQLQSQTEKESMKDNGFCKTDYGTLRARSLSVDFVDESYVTCLSEMSPHWTKKEPTHRSAATAAGLIASAMLVMLLMGVMTLHIPRILPKSRWWTELVAFILFLIIVAFSAVICQQPRHRPHLRNRVPCVPFLPLCAILMDVHLIVGLPYTSWIVFFIWSLIGALLYVCYGIWNSTERKIQDAQNENLLTSTEDCNDSDNLPNDGMN